MLKVFAFKLLTFTFCCAKIFLLDHVLWIRAAQRAVILVKNGENAHKVPAMQSEQARDEICRWQMKFDERMKSAVWQMKSTAGGWALEI